MTKPAFRIVPVVSSVCLVPVLLLAGCGTASFKRGGSSGDHQAARDRCREQGRAASQAQFEECMEAQGWVVKSFGEENAPRPAAAKKGSVAPGSASDARAAGTPAGTENSATPASSQGRAAGAADVEILDVPEEPAGPVVVKTWFKLGASAGELDAARDRCVSRLGEAHRPPAGSHSVSPEMLECLRAEGWRGFTSN